MRTTLSPGPYKNKQKNPIGDARMSSTIRVFDRSYGGKKNTAVQDGCKAACVRRMRTASQRALRASGTVEQVPCPSRGMSGSAAQIHGPVRWCVPGAGRPATAAMASGRKRYVSGSRRSDLPAGVHRSATACAPPAPPDAGHPRSSRRAAAGTRRHHRLVASFDFASSPAVTTTSRAGSMARRKAALTCSGVSATIRASNCLLHS